MKSTIKRFGSVCGTRSQLARVILETTSGSDLAQQAARGSDMVHRELRRSVLPLVLLATIIFAATSYAQGSASPPSSSTKGQQVGKILSVRKVLRNQYVGSRYPQMHYYLLYFAVRTSDQTYCAEYETPVLDEIDDLFSAKDKDVEG
jgi:hypothetical protein